MTGFRVARGGAQQLAGVTPDLTCLGKVIGGGLPVGAFGGGRSLMEQMAPTGTVYQAGTLSGNPLAMAVGCAVLDELAGGAAVRAARGAGSGAGRRAHRGGERGRRGVRGQPRRQHAHAVRRRRGGGGLQPGPGRRHRGVRHRAPRLAQARRAVAALAVRGGVPVDRPPEPATSNAPWPASPRASGGDRAVPPADVTGVTVGAPGGLSARLREFERGDATLELVPQRTPVDQPTGWRMEGDTRCQASEPVTGDTSSSCW